MAPEKRPAAAVTAVTMKRPSSQPKAPAKRPSSAVARPAAAKVAKTPTGLKLTNRTPTVKQMAFGASGIACLYRDVSEEEAHATLQAAADAGIDYIDSAPWYGAGLSELRLAKFLDGKHDITLSTKCGRIVKPLADVDKTTEMVEMHYIGHFITEAYHSDIPIADYSAAGIMESFRQSCKRLGRDTLDCLRLHDAEGEDRFQLALEGDAVPTMVQLRQQGKVREIGLGMGSAEYALRWLKLFPAGTFDSLMLAGSWNLIDQDGYDVFLECQRRGVRVVNVGVFASGVLWGQPFYRYGDVPETVTCLVSKWKKLAELHGCTLPQVAIAFALLPDVVERIAVGCNTPDQVAQNVALCGKEVPRALWEEAHSLGYIKFLPSCSPAELPEQDEE